MLCSLWKYILMTIIGQCLSGLNRELLSFHFQPSCYVGVLYLMEHEEEYVFTLPSAYARSILTIPWVELGGKVNINCARTGYSATVTFHTKPFYGGKVHRYGSYRLIPVNLLLDLKGNILGHLFGSSAGLFYSQIAEFRLLLVFEMIYSFKAVYCSNKFCII